MPDPNNLPTCECMPGIAPGIGAKLDLIYCAALAGGGGGGSSLDAGQVGFGSALNTLTGEAAFTYDSATDTLTISHIADLDVLNDATFNGDVRMGGATGIVMTASNGVLNIQGNGPGSDEALSFDFDTVANTVGVSSSTGVTLLSFSAIGLSATTGIFSSTTSLLLGTAGGAVGNIGFRNATSGTITLAPVTGALGTVTLTLPAVTDTVAAIAATQTLTNKRVTPRTNTVASSATPTINTDTTDFFTITALAAAITSFTTNLSGTPTEGQKLTIRILDDGTARAIAWGASFVARGVALPTTTVISKYLYVGFIWNSVAAVWDCVSSVQEA